MGYFFGSGMMDLVRDRLKIIVKTLGSWSTHSFKTLPVKPSGPAAFHGSEHTPHIMLLQSEGMVV